MKLIALLCFIGLATATSPSWQWQPGKEHVFHYTGRLLSGIPGLRPHFSGIGIETEVHLQVKSADDIRLSLQQVNYTQVNGPLSSGLPHVTSSYEGSNWRHVLLPHFTQAPMDIKSLLKIPVTFAVRNGEIKSITVSGTEQEWSLNFKKALVALFQTKMETSSLDLEMNTIVKDSSATQNYWKVSEETIEGVCDVIYQVNELPEYIVKERSEYFPRMEACSSKKYFEVIKTKEIDSCKKSAVYTFLKPTATSSTSNSCDSFKCLSNIFGSASSITKFYACGTRSSLVLQTIVNEGEVVQKPLGTNSEHIVTGTRQVLKLRAVHPIQNEVPKPPQPRTTESIMYEYINSGEVHRQQIGIIPKVPQSELKTAEAYKFLPRHFNPAPSSKESKQMLSGLKVKEELKTHLISIIDDLTSVEELAQKEIPLRLTTIIRGMTLLKAEELKSLYTELKSSVFAPSHANPEKVSMFHNIFFDAVMVSGTTPAVIFLKDMIKTKEISPYQANYILMLLPHHIITPTKEVFTSILEIIQSEPVVNNAVLYNTAILSMSNLVEKTCLEKTRQLTYPTAIFGQFCDSQSEIVTQMWIPYLAKALETAPTEDRKNAVIMALGLLRHKDVITLLLPILEGNGPITRPSGVSGQHVTFRNISRSMSVYAIGNVGRKHPNLVLPIIFSIYANPAENTLIRADAFHVLLKLNPPMSYLQKVAAMTWSEKNADILRKTYTAIYTLAHGVEVANIEETSPESTMTKKAQMVVHLMRKTKGVMQSTSTLFDSDYLPHLDVGYTNVFAWVSGYRSVLPSDVFVKFIRSMGEYRYKAFEAAFKLYGTSEWMDHIQNFGKMSDAEQTAVFTLFSKSGSSEDQEQLYGGRYTSESRSQAMKNYENQMLLKTSPTGLLDKTIQSVKSQLHNEWVKVVKQLNIETREDGPLASLIYMDFFDDSTFFASLSDLTSSTIQQKILPYLKDGATGWTQTIQKFKSAFCEKQIPINGQKMINWGSAEFLIPSDMGFPIIIEQTMPTIVSIRGSLEMNCNAQAPLIKLDALPMISTNYHLHVGTYSPFTQKALVTGLKQDLTINIPTRTHLKYLVNTNEVKLIFKPVEMRKPIDLIYFSTKPFTTAHSIYSFQPKCHSSEFRFIKSKVPMRVMSFPSGGSTLGLSLSATMETETPLLDVPFVMQMAKIYRYNPFNMVKFLFAPHSLSTSGKPSIRRHLFRVQYDALASSTKEVEFTFLPGCAVKTRAQKEPTLYTIGIKTSAQGQSPLWSWIPYQVKAQSISSKALPTIQGPMKSFLMDKHHMSVGFAAVARLEAKFDGGHRPRVFTYELSLGKGMDLANTTHWHLALETEPSSPSMGNKICVNGHTTVPSVPAWNIGMVRNTNMNMLVKNVIGFGKTCNESQIKTFITSRVSEKQLQWSREAPVARKCQEYLDRRIPGAILTPECEETQWLAKMYDEVDIKFESLNLPTTVRNTVVKLTGYLQSLLWPYVTENHSFVHAPGHYQSKRESSLFMTFHKPSESVSVTLKTPERHVKFSHIRVPYSMRTILPLVAGESNIKKALAITTGQRVYPTCRISKDWIRTFDNRSLPMHMDDCFHMIAGDCSTSMKFGILARSVPHSVAKEIKIYLGKTEVILTPTPSYSRGNRDVMIQVDGTHMVIPREMSKTFPVGSVTPLVQIYRSIDDVYHIEGLYNSVFVKTNGAGISISPSASMKGRLCGICGDMNGQTLADISGPRRCIFSSPRTEIAAYRVSTPQCPPLEAEIKQKLDAETSRCARYEEIPTEVIKTYASLVGKCSRQQHMILERGSESCFSTTPVTQCGAQCSPKPKQLVPKKVGFSCMKSGRVTELYREKVIQGLVLPELKSLPVTFSTAILVPQSCSSIVSGHPILSMISSSNMVGANGSENSHW